jgi:hypothetical protein
VTRAKGSPAEAVAVVVYALVDWLVIMAPALAIQLAADRGGIADAEGIDLLTVSLVIATTHAAMAARRLRFEERTAERRADIWIANLDALVVLALATTLLVLVVLVSFPDEHAALVNRGFPVALLWIGLQVAAVALAEVTGRMVFRWLEPRAPHQPTLVEEVTEAIERVHGEHRTGEHAAHGRSPDEHAAHGSGSDERGAGVPGTRHEPPGG